MNTLKAQRPFYSIVFFGPLRIIPAVAVSQLDFVLHEQFKARSGVSGKRNADGLYACYSQVTTTANNLGLLLHILNTDSKIDLPKNADALGILVVRGA